MMSVLNNAAKTVFALILCTPVVAGITVVAKLWWDMIHFIWGLW